MFARRQLALVELSARPVGRLALGVAQVTPSRSLVVVVVAVVSKECALLLLPPLYSASIDPKRQLSLVAR